MSDELGAQYLERKKVIETELRRLEGELKKGTDFQADLQRQHSEVTRQINAVQQVHIKQAGKLENINELIEGLKKEVTPKIPSEKNEKEKKK